MTRGILYEGYDTHTNAWFFLLSSQCVLTAENWRWLWPHCWIRLKSNKEHCFVMLWWWCNQEIPSKLPVIQVDNVVENCCASTQKSWNMDARDELFIGNMDGILGMVSLIINPIYTLHSGYLLGISPSKGSLGGVKQPGYHLTELSSMPGHRGNTVQGGSSAGQHLMDPVTYWSLLSFSFCFLTSSFWTCVQTILFFFVVVVAVVVGVVVGVVVVVVYWESSSSLQGQV